MNKTVKQKIQYFLSAPLRYRTKRGFGVHSPFAFQYIMNVWSEKYHYYAYSEIENKYHRLIFRTINYLRPSRIALSIDDPLMERAITLSAPRAKIFKENIDISAECFVIDKSTPELDNIFRQKIKTGTDFTVIVCNDADIFTDANYGMSFGNNKLRIYIMRHVLPRQNFNVNL
ncbi:MAG: hypothetical protein J1F10_03685 [Muribaculaceae bacterium]|nr:hypothetical protein [Muribaculaceae bacterium]